MINENWIFLGALLSLVGGLSYVRDILRGKARPNLVTWYIFALAPMIAFASMISQGVGFRQSLLTFMVGFNPLLIALTGTFFTKHPKWKITRFDLSCGALSLVGLALWGITREGNLAIVFSLAADILAFLPTIVKAYRYPDTESPWLFMYGLVNSVIAMLIITTWDFAHAAFPVYIFAACVTAIVLIYFRLGDHVRAWQAR